MHWWSFAAGLLVGTLGGLAGIGYLLDQTNPFRAVVGRR
jgi:hypothetical protein